MKLVTEFDNIINKSKFWVFGLSATSGLKHVFQPLFWNLQEKKISEWRNRVCLIFKHYIILSRKFVLILCLRLTSLPQIILLLLRMFIFHWWWFSMDGARFFAPKTFDSSKASTKLSSRKSWTLEIQFKTYESCWTLISKTQTVVPTTKIYRIRM